MTDDPVTLAADAAIRQLVVLLTGARSYLEDRETLAAIGTLVMSDDHTEDVRAVLPSRRRVGFRLTQPSIHSTGGTDSPSSQHNQR